MGHGGWWRQPLRDRLLAVGLCVVLVLPDGVNGVLDGPHLLWVAVGAALTLSVALRRQQPLTVWMITTGGAVFLLATHLQDPLLVTTASAVRVLLASFVALYTLARTDQALGRFAAGCSVVAVSVTLLSNAWQADAARTALIVALLIVIAWAVGEAVRARAESAAVRLAAWEAEKAEHDRAVAAEERARIARELHDITAHHISVVTLQAGAARLLAEAGQAPSVELLTGIETAGRQAMIEIRQALGVIRSTPDGAAPLPGVARLPELARRMGLAGLTVTIDGTAGPLPGTLELTVYRIVQEGLTNVTRHSAAGTARVMFRHGNGTLEITVADDGPPRAGRPAGPGGHGLIGLRERVTRYDGELHADHRPDGGFELRATLPVPVLAVERSPATS
jgi:signal transduction histidine kinase